MMDMSRQASIINVDCGALWRAEHMSIIGLWLNVSANILPSIFTIEIGGKPTLAFEAKNLREAHELCHEQWLKIDLAEAICDGVPLWDGKAKLRARMA